MDVMDFTGLEDRPSSRAADYPYIKSISLQNFMSHSNFKLDFGRSMNVVLGTNGSGKSSILTAIMVCLGSRASSTNRADSIGGLVRTGCIRAHISLTIHIPSELCTKFYEKYGSQVTVTRTIENKGTTKYAIRNSEGKVVKHSTAKDVHDIAHAFGFFPQNELAMLTQENAKEFLIHATPQKKYEKLRSALKQNLIEADRLAVEALEKQQNHYLQQAELRRKNSTMKLQRAEEIIKRHNQRTQNADRIQAIERVEKWNQMKPIEAGVEKQSQTVIAAEQELNNIPSPTKRAEQLSRLEQEQAEDQQHPGYDDEIEAASGEVKEAKAQVNDAMGNVRRYEEDMRSKNLEVQDIEKQVAELRGMIAGEDPETIRREIEECKAKLEEFAQQRTALQAENADEEMNRDRLKNEVDELDKRVKIAKTQQQSAEDRVSNTKRDIQALRRGGANATQFDQKMAQLSAKVNSTTWRKKPIGPLYNFVKLSNDSSKFSPVFERLWNTTLDSWWVTNDEDRKKLLSLARDLSIFNLKTFLRTDDPFDVSRALPTPSDQYKRIIDVVKFDSEAIARIFIDFNKIESTVLCEDSNSAYELQRNDKVRSVFVASTTRNGTKKFTNISFNQYSTDSSTINASTMNRIKVSNEQRIAQAQDMLKDQESAVADASRRVIELRSKYATALDNFRKSDSKLKEGSEKMKTLSHKRANINQKIQELEQKTPDEETYANITEREEVLKGAKQEYQEMESSKVFLMNSLSELEAAFNEAKSKLDELVQKKGNLDAERRMRDREILKIQQEVRQHEHRVLTFQSRVDDARTVLQGLTENLQREKASIEQSVGPKPSKGESRILDKILDMDPIEMSRKKMEYKQAANIAPADADERRKAEEDRADALREQAEVESKQREMMEFNETIKERKILRERNERESWKMVKKKIQESFKHILEARSFVGSVIIDDEKRTLKAQATPDNAVGREIDSLSGGEKSFAQIALLMSVWESMQAGFVAMDEYDVFMDKANRTLSLELLCKSVISKSMQCLLITPQSVESQVLNAVDCKIHNLEAARRS